MGKNNNMVEYIETTSFLLHQLNPQETTQLQW